MRLHFATLTIGLLSISLLFTSCGRQISSDVYSASHVGEASTTYAGIIKNVREVSVQEGERLEENKTGIATGGVLGAGAGSIMGRGNWVATAGGAVAGAVAGSLIEKKVKEQSALEYVVQIENGGLMTIVQGMEPRYEVGQPVFVIVGQFGRSRIIAQ